MEKECEKIQKNADEMIAAEKLTLLKELEEIKWKERDHQRETDLKI